MKIIHQNLKQGECKIKIENLDDLWYLQSIVETGDSILGKTLRRVKTGSEERSQASKKPMFIKLKAEKVEFSKRSLRILGIIEEGPEDIPRGAHHSFVVEPGTILTIQKKNWLHYQLDKLKEAAQAKPPKILIVVFDREEAFFAALKHYGYEVLQHISGDVQKKADAEKKQSSFYQEIIKAIEQYDKRIGCSAIILASPAFWKEDLLREMKNEELKKKIVQASCSSVDASAINEVLKRSEVQEALQQERAAQELNLVEELLTEIHKEGKAVYGFSHVKDAAEAGAISVLLITDTFIHKKRESNDYQRVEELMKSVDHKKGNIHVISSEHEGGKRLDGLGGIGALLRYQLRY